MPVAWVDEKLCGQRKVLRIDLEATGCRGIFVSEVSDSYATRLCDLDVCTASLARAGYVIVDGQNLSLRYRKQMGTPCFGGFHTGRPKGEGGDVIMLVIAADDGLADSRGPGTVGKLIDGLDEVAADARLFKHSGLTLYEHMAVFVNPSLRDGREAKGESRAPSYSEMRCIVGAQVGKLFRDARGPLSLSTNRGEHFLQISFITDISAFLASVISRDLDVNACESAIVVMEPNTGVRTKDSLKVSLLPCSLEVDCSDGHLEVAIVLHEKFTTMNMTRLAPLPGTRRHFRPCLVLSSSTLRFGHATAMNGSTVRVVFQTDGNVGGAIPEDHWVPVDTVYVFHGHHQCFETGRSQKVVSNVMAVLNA